jgi:hypothetical protein
VLILPLIMKHVERLHTASVTLGMAHAFVVCACRHANAFAHYEATLQQ